MERGGAFHGYQRLQKPISGMMSVELNTPQNQTQYQNQSQSQYGGGGGGAVDSNSDRDGACTVREQDRFMPIANVIRIMRKVLPTHAKISDDAKETIQECVSEYISFITSEANDKCQREQRKTITAEDVLWAMSKLGFDDYIEPLTAYLHRYRELEGDHRGSLRGEPLPKRAVEVSPVAAMAYGPAAFHMGFHHQGLFGGGMGAYFRDGSGANPSQAGMAGYDPFAAYK